MEKTRPWNGAGQEKEDFLETITGVRLKEETKLAQQWSDKVQEDTVSRDQLARGTYPRPSHYVRIRR